MRFHAVSGAAARRRTDCAIVGVHESGALAASAVPLDARLNGRLARLAKRGDLRGRIGETTLLDVDGGPCQRVLVVGIGGKGALTRKQYKKATLAAAAALVRSGARDAVSFLSLETVTATDAYYRGRLAAEAIEHALYRVPAIRSTRPPKPAVLAAFAIAMQDRGQVAAAERGLSHGAAISSGASLTRDLANLPANVCTPSYLASRARQLAREHRSVSARTLDERELKRLRMGAFLSVTAGTDEPARLIVLRHQGGRRGAAPIVLVGKGVTFDSGGISLSSRPAWTR